MTRKRTLLMYAAIVLASLVVALLGSELVIRGITYSTGDGSGRGARRWAAEHWVPVNAEGFRDVAWDLSGRHPALVFLGDSFTDGHGVAFEETAHHHVRTALDGRLTAFNLGRSGESTRTEAAIYDDFRTRTGVTPEVVVWQYFGNDMQDLLPPAPEWKPWPGLEAAAGVSELAELAWVYMAGVRWGRLYAEHHMQGYEDPRVFARHRADLAKLAGRLHADGARIVWLAYPFLDDDAFMRRSGETYIARLHALFAARCRAGDAFIDATPLARTLPLPERTVNRLDGHPSPRLHRDVADRVLAAIDGRSDDAVERCARAPAPGPGHG